MSNAVETHALHFEDGSAAVEVTPAGDIEINFYNANDGTEPVFSLDSVNFGRLVEIWQQEAGEPDA